MNDQVPYVEENVIDPAASLNISIRTINSLLQVSVIEVGINTPPIDPVEGDTYIVGINPTDGWVSEPNRLVRWQNGAWRFYDARYVINTFDGNLWARNGYGWFIVSGGVGGGITTWGSIAGTISNQTDLENRLSGIETSISQIPTAVSWGDITGTLSNQTDLETRLIGIENSIANIPGGSVSQPIGMVNRIINGKVEIAQRGTSFPLLTSGTFVADRFVVVKSGSSNITGSRVFEGPNKDFPYCIKITITTAVQTLQPSDICYFNQLMEGTSISDLIGNDFVISFFAKSNKPGIYCVSLRNSSVDRCLVMEYTITQPNVWQFISIPVIGGLDTTGVWNIDNSVGIRLGWAVAAGSTYISSTNNVWTSSNHLATSNQVNLLDTVGNNMSITGIDVRRGLVPTPFEHRPYALERILCQRFYEIMTSVYSSTTFFGQSYWKVAKRVSPTLVVTQAAGINPPTYTAGNIGVDMIYQSSAATTSGTVTISGSAEL